MISITRFIVNVEVMVLQPGGLAGKAYWIRNMCALFDMVSACVIVRQMQALVILAGTEGG